MKSTQSISISFLFGCEALVWLDVASNKELMKTIEILMESVKSIWDKLLMQNAEPHTMGSNLQLHATKQYSVVRPPPSKKSEVDDKESSITDELEDCEETQLQGLLMTLSEAASTFLKTPPVLALASCFTIDLYASWSKQLQKI